MIAAACDYVYVMKDGKMIENGCADDIFYNPQTEYTKKLLSDATAEQLLVKEKVFAAQENPLFTVRHLKKRFQNEEGVNDVSFDICEGEVFALAGESGSGKTTLAKILTGLEQPDSGEVFCRGERVDRKTEKKQKYAWESQDDISRSVFIPESVHDDKRNVDGNASGERKTNKV